ncbi:MAG: 50S ribosomal protein L18 [Candidatus Omnitrophota bacterium]
MKKSKAQRLKRHHRILKRMQGTSSVPRLIVCRSLANLWAQAIDDVGNKTIFSLSTMDKEVRGKFPKPGNVKAAEFFGEIFARRAKETGISKIVFDRTGYLYHGRIKAFAEALRKGGLQF